MNPFKKRVSLSEEYLIRMDALNVALDFTAGLTKVAPSYTSRDFLKTVDDIANYLEKGEIPDILGAATKSVLKG